MVGCTRRFPTISATERARSLRQSASICPLPRAFRSSSNHWINGDTAGEDSPSCANVLGGRLPHFCNPRTVPTGNVNKIPLRGRSNPPTIRSASAIAWASRSGSSSSANSVRCSGLSCSNSPNKLAKPVRMAQSFAWNPPTLCNIVTPGTPICSQVSRRSAKQSRSWSITTNRVKLGLSIKQPPDINIANYSHRCLRPWFLQIHLPAGSIH